MLQAETSVASSYCAARHLHPYYQQIDGQQQ